MIYVTSDLHGISVEEFQMLLRKADFREEDFLFVLGDVIDRGEYGAELLLWLTEQSNMQLILGNHEALMLACDFLFEEATDESLDSLSREDLMLLETWLANGGGVTIKALSRMLREDPEQVAFLLEYLQEAPLYETVEAGGREFILVHGGLGNFRPERPLWDYDLEELTMMRPEPDTRYYNNATVILGHTPTQFFDPACEGRALHGDGWIDIDTGAACGNFPMLLRLDDMKEVYL